MTQQLDITQFYRLFPDDDACLRYVMQERFGLEHVCRKCHVLHAFAKISHRRLYRCEGCSQQIAPCAGTALAFTKTSLHHWFYAICVLADDVTVRELAAHMGISFNAALRMKALIRDFAPESDWRQKLAAAMAGRPDTQRAPVSGGQDGKKHW